MLPEDVESRLKRAREDERDCRDKRDRSGLLPNGWRARYVADVPVLFAEVEQLERALRLAAGQIDLANEECEALREQLALAESANEERIRR